MIAPLATIIFLSTMWLVVVALARTIEESGSSIGAALAGRSHLSRPPVAHAQVRINYRGQARMQRPVRVTPRLRAAA